MKKFIIYFRFLPILLFYSVYKNNERLREDVERWSRSDSNNISLAKHLPFLLYERREFRNLFVYRNSNPQMHRILCIVTKIIYPIEKTLFIECPDIGGGFYIMHGFATYIAALKIGKNCSVNQQVTIGYNGNVPPPVIGDNCMIMCGAKVLGNIEIGNSTKIGANAVVIRDYKRGHGTLVGVPAVPKNELEI